MSKINYQSGHGAEELVTEHLKSQTYKILAINWRTPRCEIDIVAEKDHVVWFVEVKYRQTTTQGSGFDYITKAKLSQMRFAAAIWVAEYGYNGDYGLLAAEVDSFGEVNIVEITS